MAKDSANTNQYIHEQYIIFNLGEEEYAIPITIVEEIVKITNLIRVPQSKSYFAGVMDIRGKVVRMIDLTKRLNIRNAKTAETAERAIVINLSGKSIGVIVDKVSHVIHFPANQVDPPPPSVKGISSRYITGVGKKDNRFIILIDIEKILTVEEISEMAVV